MTKSSILKARMMFESFCLKHSIISEKVHADPTVLAYFVPKSFSNHTSKIVGFLSESARQDALQFKASSLISGKLFVLSSGTMSEESMADLSNDISSYFDGFHTKLFEILGPPIGETNLKQPDSSLRRANAGNQFPASMNDYTKPSAKKSKKPKKMDDKIEEALEGIATPDDIQPQQGLKSLFSAIKQSGLAQELKKVGVSWNVAEPGRHAVTFVSGKVPILQLTSIELGDAKKLGEVLSQLTSIAQGKAPQAAQLELDRVKEMASRANDRKSALDDIAQQYAVPKPEDQQPIIAKPQV